MTWTHVAVGLLVGPALVVVLLLVRREEGTVGAVGVLAVITAGVLVASLAGLL